MNLTDSEKQFVRERANFACEYCGVSEHNAGGELTIDHFQPLSKDGDADDLENLIYCCVRCNLYKSDFWVESPNETHLFNPRTDELEKHFWFADDGYIFGLTEKGELSIRILKLNRPQLIAYRSQQRSLQEESRMVEESRTSLQILHRLIMEQREIINTQKRLLDEQNQMLKILLEREKKS